MKNISFFQAILLGAFGLFALVGIFIFATYSGSSSQKSTAIGNVVIWGVLPQREVKAALSTLKQQNQDLKDVSYVYKDPSTFNATLSAAIASGKGPDLVLMSQERLASLMGELTPVPYSSLSQRTFTNAFADACSIYLSSKGVYGIPLAIDPLVLYYNSSLLASAGIAAPPTDWDALTGLVPHVVKLTGTKNVSQALIALGTYDNVHDAQGILSMFFLQAGVPMVSVDSQDNYVVSLSGTKGNTINTTAPGASVVRFYTQFADPTKVSYTWNSTLQDSQQMFLAGNSALYLGYASEAPFLSQANPNLSFDIAPVPQLAAAKTKTDYARVYALAVPHGAANVSGAVAVASLFASSADDSTIAQTLGLAPALRSLLSAQTTDSVDAVVYPAAIMSRAWLSPAPAVTDQIFSSMIQDVITGRALIESALEHATQLVQAALTGGPS